MRRIYISTIKRIEKESGEVIGEAGYIYVLDWDTKTLIVDPRGVTPNYSLYAPLGQSHGARGLAIDGDVLYVASSGSNILTFDLNTYKQLSDTNYQEFFCLHQIRFHDGLLYVASTGNDRLYKMKDLKIVEAVDLADVAKELKDNIVGSHKRHEKGYDQLHFNSISWDKYGDEYHVYNAAHTIYNYTKRRVVKHANFLQGMHDLIVLPTMLLLTNVSVVNATVVLTPEDPVRFINYNHRQPAKTIQTIGFTRGMAMGDNLLLIGNTPTTIRAFDRYNFNYIEEFTITDDETQSIYDIILDPRDWS